MLPHSSYAVADPLSQSQSLASTILSSSAPHQISAAVDAVSSSLLSLPPDHSRHFFSLAFPSLLSQLFGFHHATSPPSSPLTSSPASSSGWIDTALAANDVALSDKLFSLLAPTGLLFRSISAVDRLSLVNYFFPAERLPKWLRSILASVDDVSVLSDLAPVLKNRLRDGDSRQIQLNLFEYYVFWFAYYPVCRSNRESCDAVSVARSSRFKLENWVSSLSGLTSPKGGNSEIKLECSVYTRLLYAYLDAFVAVTDLNSQIPYCSSILQYNAEYDNSKVAKGEFLVNSLVCFWLLDNDFSPLYVNLCKSFGVKFPLQSVLGETPPTPGLGEVVKLLVKYLNLGLAVGRNGNDNVACSASLSPRFRMSGLFDVVKPMDGMMPSPAAVLPNGSWNLLIQRPLYRFILRTFLFCPVGASVKNVSEVFSVWVTYLEPWAIGMDDFRELDTIVESSTKNGRQESVQLEERGYSCSWEAFVLANYLYYSSLVMHFIGFAHKFLHTDAEILVQMLSKILTVLTSSKDLLDLMKTMDIAFHSKQAGSGNLRLNSLYKFVTPIREQLNDWEDGLCESDADGSFLHENWNKDLRLFSDGEDGGQQLLQLFILRAEAELQAISGDNLAVNLQCIDSLKNQVSCLFGRDVVEKLSFSTEAKQPASPRDEIFSPRRGGNSPFADIKYKGDSMKRPISDDEVGWLAKLLVLFSCWLNEILGLNQAGSNQVRTTQSYVDVPSSDVSGTKAVLGAVGSWIVALGEGAVRLVRKRGLRVNLRLLASKKVATVLLLCVVYSVLKSLWTLIW